jgi:hypothetical protein
VFQPAQRVTGVTIDRKQFCLSTDHQTPSYTISDKNHARNWLCQTMTGTGSRGLEAPGLCDDYIGHVSTAGIAENRQSFRIRITHFNLV